jgi:predicted DNA-binding transcriptional regulator AlpA
MAATKDDRDGSELVSTKELARELSVHPNTLNKWRIQGLGPRFIKLGLAVRYRRSDIEKWLRAHTRTHT